MSQCNFCTWQGMKKRGCKKATRADLKRLDHDKDEEFNAVFGPGVVIVNKEGEFAAWFMELPSHCCC